MHERCDFSAIFFFFAGCVMLVRRSIMIKSAHGARCGQVRRLHAGPRLIKLISIGPLARAQIYTFTVLRQCRRRIGYLNLIQVPPRSLDNNIWMPRAIVGAPWCACTCVHANLYYISLYILYIYIYICVCVCVCMCILAAIGQT